MFIEDEAKYNSLEEKNKRLSDILRTILRDKNIKEVVRIDGNSQGWKFTFS